MTISATNAFSGPFVPNGVTTAFPFTFAFAEGSPPRVLLDGTEVSSGLYTVTANQPTETIHEGGTVTFAVAPTGTELIVESNPTFTQSIGFTDAGPFSAESHDEANDRAAIRSVYLNERISRLTPADFLSSTARAGYYLAWDAGGDPVFSSGTGADAGLRTDLAVSTGSSLIGFIASGAGAVLRSLVNKLRGIAEVEDYGAVGDGITDDTAAIAAAFTAKKKVRFGAKTYLVSQINMLAGRQLITEGLDTIFQQKPNTVTDTPVINIGVSNVKIGSATIIGNYGGAGDTTGEGMIGILIKATAATGNLSKIRLGDYIGQNIRGDVVTTYSTDGATITDFVMGSAHGVNVQRNVVSINTGTGVRGGNVTGTEVGYMHFLVEPDGTCAPVVGCRFGHVKGRFAGAVGVDATRYIEGLEIASLDLDPSYTTGSTPAYAPGAALEDAFQWRNCKNLSIGRHKANGFNGQAVRHIYNVGELATQVIHIDSIEWTDCAKTDIENLSYCLGTAAVRLTYNHAKVSYTRSGGSVFRDCDGMKGGNTDLAIGADTIFLYVTDDAEVGPISTSTTLTGRLAQACARTKLIIGAANVDNIGYDSADMQIEGGTATAVTPFFSTGTSAEELYPVCINTRINGVEYLCGIYGKINFLRAGHMDLLTAGGEYRINGQKVVAARGAAVANAVNAAAAPTQAEFNAFVTQFNALLARLRVTGGHGLVAD